MAMKFAQVTDSLFIDARKLVGYVLNLDNPKGKDKALMFQKYLGYSKDNYQILLDQILTKALDAEAVLGINDQFGQRYSTDLEIIGVKVGQKEIVRIGWIVEGESKVARLITLYVRKRS